MAHKLFIGGLAFSTSNDRLREVFAAVGGVESASVAVDRDTGRSRGFGFVEMPNGTEARAAMAGLNGTSLGERTLTVNEARPRDDRGGGQREPRRPRW
jgi:cold-inducible RNA-binding protein